MELLVENFVGNSAFKDSDGNFLDVENWRGLRRDDSGMITLVDWGTKMGMRLFDSGENIDEEFELDGEGIIDLQWLPPTTLECVLQFLDLEGSVETSQLPRGLKHLDILYNEFVGSFDTRFLPQSIESFLLTANNLSGSFHLSVDLPNLIKIRANKNRFSGSLDFTHLPPAIQGINLAANSFSGTINLRALPESLTQHLCISGNEISQEVLVLGAVAKKLWGLAFDESKFGKIVDEDGNLVLRN
eukprot:CAMPEP_0201530018 /NCGR_PEP_ID=MMETSP0161_2-20130828/43503_1 /ASSEMBLY_ACC=CAM_ASM_000251 /TAXON_ID=180227 /ORGANISM="Neoparamoeba aestuarina, Strain SoJaBio B1-5/56/2" /LENGTH=243 /DNA_ID=CAMNT_0047932135 /DNA_START=14 /DNA_END=742 /DNA_ORIENTATION=+